MYSPEAFKQVTRKARKQHKCCECLYFIKPGDNYIYSSGVWDSTPDSFKQCIECANLFKTCTELAEQNDYDDESFPSFGNAHEWMDQFKRDYGV